MLYFKLAEFEKQSKIGNNNTLKANINTLVNEVLDPARGLLQKPIIVTSGYRSIDWELKQKRNGKSQHCRGEAADLKCSDNATLFNIIKDNFTFDQLIWEQGDNNAPAWVHVSYKRVGVNRKEVLKYANGRYTLWT